MTLHEQIVANRRLQEDAAATIDTRGAFTPLAHYCNDKTVRINGSTRPVGGTVYKVDGKRDARAIAARFNAKCWNF